ncbi:MAG: 30S ribosomal protein S16 [Patescibacteria group bacterium]
MLTIRLRRTGKKGQPNYRIVVANKSAPIYGQYLEMLGNFNPHTKAIVLDNQKTLDWLNKGAKPSNTVAKILTKQGLKHKLIVIKKFRPVSKKELEVKKTQEEKQRAEEQAKKEAQKEAFEKQVEAEKAEKPAEDKLQEAAEESIKEEKVEEAEKVEKQEEKPAEKKENHSEEKPAEKEKS